MRGLIPRQMFDIAIQASIGNQIVPAARSRSLRRDGRQLYGGDVKPEESC